MFSSVSDVRLQEKLILITLPITNMPHNEGLYVAKF